ncbi:hypothetical protein N431DRAFT_404411 [Stipitochalara longipes BDJ]|nr:hypothetical protein N431DRAFT_404411 [Stipitochalara longipes BDJ]
MANIVPYFRRTYNTFMSSNDPDHGLDDVDTGSSEPLLDAEAQAAADAEQLEAHVASSKSARRRSYIRLSVGTIAVLAFVGIFVRLSRWRRPFDFLSHQQPEFFPEYQSQRVKIRYGPFTVPRSGHDNGMKNFITSDARAPCENCVIVWMQAGLEFLDGKQAGVKEKMWLHHTVLVNTANQAVHNCDKAMRRQRFFASGNERSVMDLSGNGTEKRGYWFGEGDTIYMATELMNTKKKEQTVALTITYEYIPYLPEEFSTTTPVWLDIGGCHPEIPVPTGQLSFELGGPAWNSSLNGQIVNVVSHLHDGGVKLRLQKDGKDVCVSEAEYGITSNSKGHKHDMEMSHITRMSECSDVGRISAGEDWTVKAQYDLDKHKPMLDEHGEPEPVMGIAVVYVVED